MAIYAPFGDSNTCGYIDIFHSIVETPHTMRTNFVLVDFENIQPKDLGLLQDGPFKVKLFLGPNQAKVPVALASSLQALGSNAEYVVLETAGNNALDFHIAYYIGVLSAEDPRPISTSSRRTRGLIR